MPLAHEPNVPPWLLQTMTDTPSVPTLPQIKTLQLTKKPRKPNKQMPCAALKTWEKLPVLSDHIWKACKKRGHEQHS